MEFLHTVGDILAKISVNCVINLYAALLFTCLFLWVSLVYVACLRLLLFQYESVHLRNVFSCLCFIYKASARALCVCFNCMQFVKFIWNNSLGKMGMLQYVPQ